MSQKSYLVYLLLLTVACLFFTAPSTARADTLPADTISAQAYVLMDADSGKLLASKNPHRRLPPASMTKLMTLLLTLEALDEGEADKNDQVVSSKYACSMEGTSIYLEPGEIMTLDDMIKGMTLASANDASVAVAEYLADSETAFVEEMNQKAREIGMKDTFFKNVNGLPADGHYSSAYDMALLAKYTLANTSITDYTSLKQHNLRQGEYVISNSNRLLWRYAGADGLKTGYTSEAKNCLVATAKRDNLRLIVVVMGCPMRGGHTQDAMTLLDYGFDHYSAMHIIDKGTVCGTVKVRGGVVKQVEAVVAEEINAIYPKIRGGSFSRHQELDSRLKAPVKRGQKVGETLIFEDGKLLKKVDLLAANDVPRLNLAGRVGQIPWGFKVFIAFIIAVSYIRNRRIKLHKNRVRKF
ncbi:D-alanyl-D-alanine carboxypeptidase family protein [Syntrophomonas erecta]